MGMDGLSFSNTASIRQNTSADLASKTEQAIQSDPTNMTRQVLDVTTNPKVKEKDESEGQNKKKNQNPEQEVFEDGLVEDSEDNFDLDEELTLEDLENPNKDFYVKLNVKDDIIELYDSATDRLIETISGNELKDLVCKLNMASGIFVNKKV